MDQNALVVRSRSVGTIAAQSPCVLFRTSELNGLFSAHASADGTVFVQLLREVLHGGSSKSFCICAINAKQILPTIQRWNDPNAQHSPPPVHVDWLATDHHVLVIYQGACAALVSITPCVSHYQTSNRLMLTDTYTVLCTITTSAPIETIACDGTLSTLFLTTHDGELAHYRVPTTRLPTSARAGTSASQPLPLHSVWQRHTTKPHALLDCSLHGTAICVSASTSESAIAVWRPEGGQASSWGSSRASLEWLKPSCPVRRLLLRPADHSRVDSAPPTLLAVCEDGALRLWVENVVSHVLPESLLAHGRAHSGEPLPPRVMCLVHVLTPPTAHPLQSAVVVGGWADPLPQTNGATGHEHISWLVAAVLPTGGAPAAHDRGSAFPIASAADPEGDAELSDEVYAWAVTVEASRPRSLQQNGSAASGGSAAALLASSQTPHVKAVLWGRVSQKLLWEERRALWQAGGTDGLQHRSSPLLLQCVSTSIREGTPLLKVGHAAISRHTAAPGHAERRCLVLDLVNTADTPTDGSSTVPELNVLEAKPCLLAPPVPELVELVVHPHDSMAATIDVHGRVLVWRMDPVDVLMPVPPMDSPARAIAWMCQPARAQRPAQEACALLICTASQIHIFPVSVSQGRDGVPSSRVFSAPLSSHLPESLECGDNDRLVLSVVVPPLGTQSLVSVCVYKDVGASGGMLADAGLRAVVGALPNPVTAPGVDRDDPVMWLPEPGSLGDGDLCRAIPGGLLVVRCSNGISLEIYKPDQNGFRCLATCGSGAVGSGGLTPTRVVLADAHVRCGQAVTVSQSEETGPCGSALSFYRLLPAGTAFQVKCDQVAHLGYVPAAVKLFSHRKRVQPLLALAHAARVDVWMPAGPTWVLLSTTTVPGTPHSLSAAGERLCVGLQGQIIVTEPCVRVPGAPTRLSNVWVALNGPQPLWQPFALMSLMLRGAHGVAALALKQLLAVSKGLQDATDAAAVEEAVRRHALDARLVCAGMLEVRQNAPALLAASARQAASPVQRKGAVPGTVPVGPGRQLESGLISGAFGKSSGLSSTFTATRNTGAQQQAAASGMLSMGAFGMAAATDGTAAASAAGEPAPGPAGALQSGVLDMSAFGAMMGNSFAAPPPPEAAAAAGQEAPTAATALDTGLVDMSAFGMQPPAPSPAQEPPAAPQRQAAASALDTGVVDMSAFGLAPAQPEPTQSPAPAAASALATGQVDMSAFGMAPAAASPPTQQEPEHISRGAPGAGSGGGPSTAGPPAPRDTEGEARQQLQRGTGEREGSGGAHDTSSSSVTRPGAGPVGEGHLYWDYCIPCLKHSHSFDMFDTEGYDDVYMDVGLSGEEARTNPLVRESIFRLPQRSALARWSSAVQGPMSPGPVGESSVPAQNLMRRSATVQEAASSWRSRSSLAVAAYPHAPDLLLKALEGAEPHVCGPGEGLRSADMGELRAFLERDDPERVSAASLGVQGPVGALLLRVAERLLDVEDPAVAANAQVAKQLQSLDLPGRRFVSAAQVGAALLEFEWDEGKQEGATAGGARPRGASTRYTASLASSMPRVGSMSPMRRAQSPSAARLSATLSGDVLSETYSQGLSTSLLEGAGAGPTPSGLRRPAGSDIHLLATLQHTTLNWAFDCSMPKVLLDTVMPQMPASERGPVQGAASATATSAAFGSATRKEGSNAWTWANFRRIGAGFWLTDEAAVLAAVDRIAKATFATEKDAQAVALWYIAQGKLSLLGGLMRTVRETRIAAFLSRDFTSEEGRRAAAKNAHTLLSQHRHILAVGFFLLAQDVHAAIDTCLEALQDPQLAVVVCRLLDVSGWLTPPEDVARRGGFARATLLDLLDSEAAGKDALYASMLKRAAMLAPGPYNVLAAEAAAAMLAPPVPPDHSLFGAKSFATATLYTQAADWSLHSLLAVARLEGGSGRVAAHSPLPTDTDGPALLSAVSALLAAAACKQSQYGCALAALDTHLRLAAAQFAVQSKADAGVGMGPVFDGDTVAATYDAVAASLVAATLQVHSAQPLRLVPAGAAAPGSIPALPGMEEVLRAVHACVSHADVARSLRNEELLCPSCASEDVESLRLCGMLPWEDREAAVLADLTRLTEDPEAEPAQAPEGGARGPPESVAMESMRIQESVAEPHGPQLLSVEGARRVAMAGDRDAQAVACCMEPSAKSGAFPDVAIATKKHGLMLQSACAPAPRLDTWTRTVRFAQMYEQVVEQWAGGPIPEAMQKPAQPSARLSAAQHKQRLSLVSPKAGECVAQVLKSHPRQPTFLSGSGPGYLHLWYYTDLKLKATYAPLPYSRHMTAGTGGATPQPSQVSHWQYPTDVAFSATGARFAAVGKGGWVALWRYEAQWADTVHGRIGCCDWSHHCIAKQGSSISFIGSRATLLMVAGSGAHSRNITLWDVLMPLNAACLGSIGTIRPVNSAVVAHDDVTVVAVDKHGSVTAHDLRKLTSDPADDVYVDGVSTSTLWTAERAHPGGASCISLCPHEYMPASCGGCASLVATGGRDGTVRLWDANSGECLQALDRLHWTPGRSMFGFGSEDRVPSKVKDVEFHTKGIVSVGHNHEVLLTPWTA